MIELRIDTKGFGRSENKKIIEWINEKRVGRYGTIDILWDRNDLLLRFYDHQDVLAFKLTFDYDKIKVKSNI